MKRVMEFLNKYVFFTIMAALMAVSGSMLTFCAILGNQRGTVPGVPGTPDHTVTGDSYIP